MATFFFYIFLAWQYSALFWLGDKNLAADAVQVYGQMEKPYVYRQLVPLLARAGTGLGLRVDLALVLAVALSIVLAILAMGTLVRQWDVEYPDRKELIAACLLFVSLLKDVKIYDFATVATFAFCLVALRRRQFGLYQIFFLLACLNRETTFLLIFFFAVYFFQQLDRRTYFLHLVVQLITFLAVRIGMLIVFHANTGTNAQFHLFENLQQFQAKPIWTLLQVAVFVGLYWIVIRRWRHTPPFLRLAVVTFFFPLLGLYLLFGVAFELRVFLELFPALFAALVLKSDSCASSGPRAGVPGAA